MGDATALGMKNQIGVRKENAFAYILIFERDMHTDIIIRGKSP